MKGMLATCGFIVLLGSYPITIPDFLESNGNLPGNFGHPGTYIVRHIVNVFIVFNRKNYHMARIGIDKLGVDCGYNQIVFIKYVCLFHHGLLTFNSLGWQAKHTFIIRRGMIKHTSIIIESMRLFLASEAKNEETVKKLRDYIGGFKGKKIAYIPTAANGEEPFGSWKESSSTWLLVQTLGAKVTGIQLEDYKNASVIDDLRNKDILWFAGGYPGYLMYWIRRCEVDKALPELLEKSLYVGSSAGSMVTSKNLGITEWYLGEEEPGASVIPGLGLVDFEIYPHYEDSMYDEIKKCYKGNKLYLLKNGEEVLVEEGKVKVLGEERVIGRY